jgi:hypothetical protein
MSVNNKSGRRSMGSLFSGLRFKQVAYLAGVLIPALLTTVSAAPPADEVFRVTDVIFEPNGASFKSGDISFVDPVIRRYFNADRTNAAVDRVDTDTNAIDWLAAGKFAGLTADHGPNGVVTANKSTEVWAGDGDSTVKVVQLSNKDVIFKTIKTGTFAINGTGGTFTPGTLRADELCYDPVDNLVLVANDRATELFMDFIDTKSYKVVKSVSFKGSDPNALNLHATSGIEQCQYSPRTGKFYLALPEINGLGHGAVVVFDPKTMNATTFFPISAADCGVGPAGMAIGPNNQILLGCNSIPPNSTVIINENSGAIIARLANQGGSDEVWFNPGDGHYFLGETGNCGTCAPGTFAQLGVVDAVSHHADQSVPTVDGAAGRAGSVAADPHTNKVFLPARADGVSTICSSLSHDPKDNARGCIVVLTAKHDDRGVRHEHDEDDHDDRAEVDR